MLQDGSDFILIRKKKVTYVIQYLRLNIEEVEDSLKNQYLKLNKKRLRIT